MHVSIQTHGSSCLEPCVLSASYRAPDSAKVKHKMLYASSKDALRKKLVGISTEIQGTELSEVDYDAVLERVKNV